MTFRETFYNVKGLLEDRLHDFGLESADASTMGWTTMLSIEQNTRVTIDVPLNLIYSDAFLITGTLETSTYSRLNGKTVKLKVGDTVVDTTTTNVNGEYSFTHTPVSTGTHSFQVIFEGTNVHAGSESSIVTREVGKETSVMNLDAQSTKHYGDNVILGGTLLTDDGEYIKNASVKYYVDNSLISTLTTDNYGVFTAPTRTIDGFDSLNVQFVYEGDSNYTSVSASQTVDVYQLDLRLTGDKNILSYADNESATITAQLIDNAPTPQNLAIADTEIIFTYPSTSTAYSDFSSIPAQYDSFELLFKSQGATFYIYGDDEYPSRQIDIPNNNSSKFRLIWDKTKLSLYQDDEVLLNSITDYFDGEAVTSYTDSHVRFATLNNNTVDLTNIKIQNILSNTIDTDANGQAIFTYNSQGIGDITISANIEGSLLIQTYAIEDCIFYDATERVGGGGSNLQTGTVYPNWNIQLPSNFVWEMDMKVSSCSSSEDRFFLTNSNFSGEQPPTALWVQYASNCMLFVGARDNGTQTIQTGVQGSANTYAHFKVEVNGNTITGIINDTPIGSMNVSWLPTSSNWWFSYTFWKRPNITGTWKNLKIKAL